jgi:hypothetical protein
LEAGRATGFEPNKNPHLEEARSAVSKDEDSFSNFEASWFETRRFAALLTMRIACHGHPHPVKAGAARHRARPSTNPHPEEARSAVSKDEDSFSNSGTSWFETRRFAALLTMRVAASGTNS